MDSKVLRPLRGSKSTKRIILFNGPPGVGKDAASKIISEKLHGMSYSYKMALPLKEACHKLLGLQGSLEDLEHLKATPIKFLISKDYTHWPNGMILVNEMQEMTLRQFYIHISENVMKPMFGNDIFGKLAVENLLQSRHAVITVSDSGFAPEAQPVIDCFGRDHVCLVKLHRPGTSFQGDSRSHLDLDVDVVLNIENNGDLKSFEKNLWSKLSKNFLKGAV